VLARWAERDRQEFARLMGRFVEDLRESNYASAETAR
jgi:hypothetical protein